MRPLMAGGSELSVPGGMLAVFVTVPFWFVGFDTIPQGAEEAEVSLDPRKLGLLILTAIVGSTLFYVTLIMSVSLIAPWQTITAADLPTARAFEAAFQSSLWVQLVLFAAMLGLFTSWNGFFLAGSRVLFSMGRGRIIAPAFGATHPVYRTPHRAVLFIGAFTLLAPLLGGDALLAFVNAGSFCIGAAFLGVSLSTIRLRRKFPGAVRPYRIRGGLTIPYLAVAGALFILAVMVIPGSPAALAWPRELLILMIVVTSGALFWFGARGIRCDTPERERAYLILEDYAD
jgi:amino acid transporter